jgi:hypothetical protein
MKTVTAMDDTNLALFMPVGPVAEAFAWDFRKITGIMGPVGSAKTTTCIRKIINITLQQNPGRDGVLRSRGCVVRDTYGQLQSNVMESFFSWFPKDMPGSEWNGELMRYKLRGAVVKMEGQEPVKFEIDIWFKAMGDHKAEDVLKGLELTWLWLNEVDTLNRDVLRFGIGRLGRYPSKKDGGCALSCVMCDFNAPDEDNWTYELLVERQLPVNAETLKQLEEAHPEGVIGYHRQPGGRSVDPPPENIENLPDHYYTDQMAGMDDHLIRRMVDNEFGAVRHGQVVYPEFNEAVHVAKEPLTADPALPLLFGLDGGRTPALVVGQLDDHVRQLRILREVVLYDPIEGSYLERLGPTAFGQICADLVGQDFPDCDAGVLFFDPAVQFGQEDDGYDWIEFFTKEFPVQHWSPGSEEGNRVEPRLEAVRRRLTELPAGQPSILLNPDSTRVVRRAFRSHYIFERVESGSTGSGKFRSIPIKNDESHAMDAVAELCIGIQNRSGLINRMRQGAARRAAQGGNVDYGKGYFRPNRAA